MHFLTLAEISPSLHTSLRGKKSPKCHWIAYGVPWIIGQHCRKELNPTVSLKELCRLPPREFVFPSEKTRSISLSSSPPHNCSAVALDPWATEHKHGFDHHRSQWPMSQKVKHYQLMSTWSWLLQKRMAKSLRWQTQGSAAVYACPVTWFPILSHPLPLLPFLLC